MTDDNTMMQRDRALGALHGLSLGDALGMPTQSMSAEWIAEAYGRITDLTDAIADQPIAPNMHAGAVTDDTEQALLVGGLIVDGAGHIDLKALARTLLDWENSMKARGSFDLLGPSTKLALEQVRDGADITTTGRTGTTNGAAMRVTPVGMAHSLNDEHFADYVYESCRVTHNTKPGFQGAFMVAAVVSLGIDGMDAHEAMECALDEVVRIEPRGAWSPRASVVARTRLALTLAGSVVDDDEFLDRLRAEVGTSVESNESIAAAFSLAWRYANEPIKALLAAANVGGDTDTIAAIAGAMLGAAGGAFPEPMLGTVCKVSHLDLEPLVDSLLEIRSGVNE